MQLSVIIPVFNERGTLLDVVRRIEELYWEKEILLVDDGSNDGTTRLVRQLAKRSSVRAFFHGKNLGKGAAIRTALAHATGAVVIIQDGDLEYDPSEIGKLVSPILECRADVVYGSRFDTASRSACKPLRRVANRLLTWLSNRCTGLRLTDMETCYKAFRRDVLASMCLRENRFGIEPELTAKTARGGWRVMEVPISYVSRSYRAGKKIGLRDGVRSLYCIFRYAWFD